MTFDERLERDLDAWWDDEAAGRAHPDAAGPDAADIETIQRLHAANPPAVPTPNFVNSLREDLMQTAKQSGAPWPLAAPPYFKQLRTYDLAAPQHDRARPRRQLLAGAELAAVTFLIFALAASAIFGAPRSVWSSLFHQITVSTPAATPETTNQNAVAVFRGDSGRTGMMPGPGLADSPAVVVWRQPLGGVFNTPLYANGRVFATQAAVGEVSARVYALDVKTGEPLWKSPVGSDQVALPTLDNQYVFILTDQQTLVALEQDTGKLVWTYSTGGTLGNASPAVANGLIFVKVNDQSVRAVDVATGTERWRSLVPPTTLNQPANDATIHWNAAVAVSDGVVYAAGDGGVLYAFNAQDGKQRWRFQTKSNVIPAISAINGMVYLISVQAGPNSTEFIAYLYAINADHGSESWHIDGIKSSWLAVDQSAVYVADSAKGPNDPADSLSAFSVKDGQKRWSSSIRGPSAPVLADGNLYVTGVGSLGEGYVYALVATDGSEVWQIHGAEDSPLVVSGLVIVPTGDSVVALDGAGGSTTPEAALDLAPAASPQGACIPPRSTISASLPAGTPVATIIHDRPQVGSGRLQILVTELPAGPAASPAVIAAIEQTLNQMADCVAQGTHSSEGLLSGFATDDYLRRPQARVQSQASGHPYVWPIYGVDNKPLRSVSTATILSDGRIGATFMLSERSGWYIVFAKQDGHWLIDEDYEIVRFLGRKG